MVPERLLNFLIVSLKKLPFSPNQWYRIATISRIRKKYPANLIVRKVYIFCSERKGKLYSTHHNTKNMILMGVFVALVIGWIASLSTLNRPGTPPAPPKNGIEKIEPKSRPDDPPPPPPPWTPPEVIGVRTGLFEGRPAELVIVSQKEEKFTGILSEQTEAGEYRIAFEGELYKDVEGTGVRFKETRVLEEPKSGGWILGDNVGKIEGEKWSGTGTAKGMPNYTWEFSKSDLGLTTLLLTKVKYAAEVELSSQEDKSFQEDVATIAKSYDTKSEAYHERDAYRFFANLTSDWRWETETGETSTLEQSRKYMDKVFNAAGDLRLFTFIDKVTYIDSETIAVEVVLIMADAKTAHLIGQIDVWKKVGEEWRCNYERRVVHLPIPRDSEFE